MSVCVFAKVLPHPRQDFAIVRFSVLQWGHTTASASGSCIGGGDRCTIFSFPFRFTYAQYKAMAASVSERGSKIATIKNKKIPTIKDAIPITRLI